MNRRTTILLIAVTAWSAATGGAWEIPDYQVQIEVQPDSSLAVTETIVVDDRGDPLGQFIRVIPVRYQTEWKAAYQRDYYLSDFQVTDPDGNPCRFAVSGGYHARKITIDRPSLPGDAIPTYQIQYRVQNALVSLRDWDGLFWYAANNEWHVAIRRLTVTVTLPRAAPEDKRTWTFMPKECRAGWTSTLREMVRQSSLAPHQSDSSVYVYWDGGIVQRPGWFARTQHTVISRVAFVAALAMLLLSALWLVRSGLVRWSLHRRARDQARQTMDFFGSERRARWTTRIVLLYSGVAAVFIALGAHAATVLASRVFYGCDMIDSPLDFWDSHVLYWIAGITLAVIGSGTYLMIRGLAEGGAAVAKTLGGRLVDGQTSDLRERQLLNVVEELALASGLRVPPVYLLDHEPGINAFAAGFTGRDAVIAVSGGCLKHLNRDELQGVLAHEFSHVLNGDMRLNLRLMGVLYGILMIFLAGYYVCALAGRAGLWLLWLFVVGIPLLLVGSIGALFARLIKSAVSRQREYLADAYAVEFTRNSSGIVSALLKIGGLEAGSRIQHPDAEQVSHMFFANGVGKSFLQFLLATHPPLAARIRRIDPSFDGHYPQVTELAAPVAAGASTSTGPPGQPAVTGAVPPTLSPGTMAIEPGPVVSMVGAPTAGHLEHAVRVRAALPAALTEAVHQPSGAVAVTYCLLLGSEGEVREKQVQFLAARTSGAGYARVREVLPLVEAAPEALRLPLADLCLPSLRTLSAEQFRTFRSNVERLLAIAGEPGLLAYTVHRILLRNLEPWHSRAKVQTVRYQKLGPLIPQCVSLLSGLAHFGTDDAAATDRAFAAGWIELGTAERPAIRPRAECSVAVINQSLDDLAAAAPPIRQKILAAAAACIGADGRVTVPEAELLRAVADSLDCPIPPFIADPGAPLKNAE